MIWQPLSAVIAVRQGFPLAAGMSLSILIVLTGILLCIYIGKEYTSGQIKNIITSHANKCDYIFAKTVIAFLWTSVFNVIYLLTLFVLGMVMGVPAGIAQHPQSDPFCTGKAAALHSYVGADDRH